MISDRTGNGRFRVLSTESLFLGNSETDFAVGVIMVRDKSLSDSLGLYHDYIFTFTDHFFSKGFQAFLSTMIEREKGRGRDKERTKRRNELL